MAGTDYGYQVFSTTLTPFQAAKENMDITRLVYDFTCWLDADEVIEQIDFPTIQPVPPGQATTGNWQVDYPLSDTPTAGTTPPADTYPMSVLSEAITANANTVDIKVIAGTPTFQYVLSFTVTGSSSRRRKQVDTIITIEPLVNKAMAGPGDIGPDTMSPPLIISDSVSLPMGFTGIVLFSNSGNIAGVVITLPPNPNAGDMVEFVDCLGKDAAYPVTFRADGDQPVVDADGSIYFVSTFNYDFLRWVWTGVTWHMTPWRYTFLG